MDFEQKDRRVGANLIKVSGTKQTSIRARRHPSTKATTKLEITVPHARVE